MNKYINKFATLLFGSAIVLSSCTGDFDEINTDPDRPKAVPASSELAFTLRYLADQLHDDWFDIPEPSAFAGQIAKQQYTDETWYNFRPGTYDNNWYYIGVLHTNLKDIKRLAANNNNQALINAAELLDQYIFQITTDRWRDVPYDEATKLAEGVTHPKYETQEEIYPKILAKLQELSDSYAAGVDDTDGELEKGDIMLGGDINLWEKWCNSMILRVAMRISAVAPTEAKAAVKKIVDNQLPILESVDENIFFVWDDTYNEPLAQTLRTRPNDYAVADVMIDKLKQLGDPRLYTYAKPTEQSVAAGLPQYVGAIVGKEGGYTSSTLSKIGEFYAHTKDQHGISPIFRAAETYFNLAEAGLTWPDLGIDVQEAYETAVTLSLDETGDISQADITAYLTGAAAYDGTKEQIYYQWWISLFKEGMEAWSLMRRTDVPHEMYIAPNSKYPGHFCPPLRSPYPNNELMLNTENVKLYSNQVVDHFWGKPMWYDQRNADTE